MTTPASDGDDDARFAELGADLGRRIADAIGPWVERSVLTRYDAWAPDAPAAARSAVADAARIAGARVAADLRPDLDALLAADADSQWTTPLALARRAVGPATEVLAAFGVPAVVRDGLDEQTFPDDVYGLAPATFADIHPTLAEPGLVWGAAKAHVVISRRRHST